tara:strand:- start:479 stop:796 length:318 start_codon:yes stop_codon:yes gene_type:complete
MRKFLLTIGVVSALAPLSTLAFSLDEYEAQTKVAQRYVSGEMDQRMIELGQNFTTKEFNVVVGKTQKNGVETYCRYYALFGDVKLNGSCNRTIKAPTGSGTYVSF